MRKVYSLVLMAAALLVGTNANAAFTDLAVEQGGNDVAVTIGNETRYASSLKDAVLAASTEGKTTIKLLNPITISEPIEIAVVNQDDPAVNIDLDLNGKSITYDGKKNYAFRLRKGILRVMNGTFSTSSTTGTAIESMFLVLGSTLDNCNPRLANSEDNPYFSHLIIEESAIINSAQNGICVDANQVTAIAGYPQVKYTTAIYASNKGVAHGARVDVYGTINAQKYGIKTNGWLQYPSKEYQSYASGIDKEYIIEEKDTAFAPFVYVHKNAIVSTSESASKATAIYCSGYARWQIEGTCLGNTAVYVHSGPVTIDGATLTSTGTVAQGAQSGRGSGIEAGGSAIVVDGNAKYAGAVDLTIKGETKITATSGYALEGVGTGDKVDEITIESGTIAGGQAGLINLEVSTIDVEKVEVTGGSYNGDISIYIPQDLGFITQFEDEDGKTYFAVSTLDEGDEWAETDTYEKLVAALAEADETKLIKVNFDVTLAGDVTAKYMSVAAGKKVTIPTGKTLRVGELVMGNINVDGLYSSIIVEAGAHLIVEGEQGMIATDVANLVLKADATNGMATFVLNPNVQSNKSPWATVEYMTGTFCGSETLFDKTKYHWEVLSSPFAEISEIKSDPAYFSHIVNGSFVNCSRSDIVNTTEAFDVFAICSNTTQGNPTKFTFKGKLQGANSLENYGVNRKFNYIGNAYMGKMNAKEMVQELQQSASAVHTLVYLWNVQYMKWDSYNGYQLDELENVNPMAAIVLYSDADGSVNLDYEKLIWNTNK